MSDIGNGYELTFAQTAQIATKAHEFMLAQTATLNMTPIVREWAARESGTELMRILNRARDPNFRVAREFKKQDRGARFNRTPHDSAPI